MLLDRIQSYEKKILIIFTLFLLVSAILGASFSFLIAISIWAVVMGYALKDIKNRLLLIGFLTTFFVFLLGGHLVYELFGIGISYYFSDEYYIHSNITISISLLFVLFGIVTTEKIILFFEKNRIEAITKSKKNEDSRLIIRNLAKFFYISSYIFYIYIILEKVIFTLDNSYLDYYVNYNRNTPFLVTIIGAMAPHFLFLFLATLPTKKEVLPLIGMQLFYGIVSLLTGRRTDFMVIILFVVFYFIFRQYYSKDDINWINKKMIITILVISPILLILMFLYRYIRHDMSISSLSIKQILLGFFQQQGFSSSVLRLGLYHEELLRDDTYYSFFGLVKFTRTNSLIRLLYRPEYGFSYIGNSVDFALKGNSLSHTLSYHTLSNYLGGWGVGSCYIAELYQDFKYLGIIVGNTVYGSIISIINYLWMRNKKYNIWVTALCFGLIEPFLRAPRWNFDIIFTEFLSLGRWSAFLGVFICIKILTYHKFERFISKKLIKRLKNEN